MKNQVYFDNQQILHTVLNHIPAMIGYWDKDLINKFSNKNYEEWFGLSYKDIYGKHYREVLGEKLFAINLPYLQAALSGEPQLFERTITDISGTERYTQTSYIPDIVEGRVQGFFVLVTEITELKRSQQRISESEASLQAMFDNLPFLAWMKSMDGHFVYANKNWIHHADLNCLEDIYGKTDFDFWPKELAEHYRQIDQEVMQTRQQKTLVEKSLNIGKEHWVETWKMPVLNEHGQILGIVGLARDVTESRENRREAQTGCLHLRI